MLTSGLVRLGMGMAIAVIPLAATHAQEYPTKLIRIVVPFPAGSASDILARTLGQGITEISGQNVIVDNRPGANGLLAGEYVARSQPDGYTILLGTHTTHAANHWLLKNMPYDAEKDFAPVSALAKGWSYLLVNPESSIKSLSNLAEKARKAPGAMTYGGGGATSRISVEHFGQIEKIKFVYVGYRGNSEAVNDLIGGRLDFMISDSITALPQIRAGKLRALAFTGTQRSPAAPDVPTFIEAGIPGYENNYWQAAYVPAKTPPSVIKRLNSLLHQAMGHSGVKKYLESNGVVSFLTTPEELAGFQKEQSKMMGEIIRNAGIEPQ